MGLRNIAGRRWGALEGFLGEPPLDDAWDGFLAVAGFTRLIIAACAIAVVWALPTTDAGPRLGFTLLVAFLYVAYSRLARRINFRPFGFRCPVTLSLGDLLVVFAFQVLMPSAAGVALLGYLLIVAVHTSIGGPRAGLMVGAASAILATSAEALTPTSALSFFTLCMLPVVMVALCLLLEATRRGHRHARFFAFSSDLLSVTGRDGVLRDVNAAWESVLGYTRGELLATHIAEFIHPEDRERTARLMAAGAPDNASVLNFENRFRTKGGSYRWLAWRAAVSPRDSVYYCVARDVTAEKEAEDLLAHQATHDALTGLPNRTLLLDRLRMALARGARRPDSVAVLFLDLDDFKVVNDSLGHAEGDAILAAAGQRLADALRPADTVARFGGDEFVVLCEELTGLEHGRRIADRLLEALAPPLPLPAGELHLRACVGIAFAGCTSQGPEELLRDADAAMYRAKESGPGEIVVFDSGVRDRAVARLETETDLRRALEDDELRLYYQPGVDLTTGSTVAVEALLRWQHPTRGLLRPEEFLAVAERTGLIVPIGTWVLDEACRQLAAWKQEIPDVAPLGVGINVSNRQLRSPMFPELVEGALARAGLDPWNLYVEVTEGTLMDEGMSLRSLERVAELGVPIGIDDFGTGYSSLDRLCKLPITFLKLDRSFVSGPGERAGDPGLLAAVTELAHALGMPAVAEGPETAQQLELVRDAGFHFAQGNCFGAPAPPEDVAERLRAGLPGSVVS